MALQGIAHKNLTDPQLHEPKGASTAEANTVLFADGEGSTEFRTIDFSDVHLETAQGGAKSLPTFTDPTIIYYDSMGATTTGILTDAGTFPQVNKNVKELAVAYMNLRTQFIALRADYLTLIQTYNKIASALTDLGIISDDA